MFIVTAYIKFLWRSTNQHGVHSPFVYSLVTKCFYDKKKYSAYKVISDYRKSLLESRERISVTDFGAGSKVFKSPEREVSKMAKSVGISRKRAKLLNRLVRYLEVKSALELGTSLGIGTAAMAAGNSVNITTVEGCPETAAVAERNFQKFNFNNIDLKVEKFEEFIVDSGQWTVDSSNPNSKTQNPKSKGSSTENFQPTTDNSQLITGNLKFLSAGAPAKEDKIPNSEDVNTTFDLVYFDGNHQKQATLDYFEKLLPKVHNDTVFIFDDIHWSREMEEAWEEIKQHPAVKVTVDTFFWGFVFFRKEQEKEHFVIRI